MIIGILTICTLLTSQQPAKQPVSRTQSAPIRNQAVGYGAPPPENTATDTEINARLDSLCRSVTECALGGQGNSWQLKSSFSFFDEISPLNEIVTSNLDNIVKYLNILIPIEPRYEKTGFLLMRKQRRRSA